MWPLIDILKLHKTDDTEKSSVRAFGGAELNRQFGMLYMQYVKQTKTDFKTMARKVFGVNPNSIQNWRGMNKKYPEGHPIPIWALNKILDLLHLQHTEKHIEIIKNIEYLQCGRISKKVNAVKYLTPTLAKLCGAHAADGCLYKFKDRVSTINWEIGDKEKENIEAVKKWLFELFGLKIKTTKRGNMYYFWTNMQVVSRYLTQIFDFPTGKKSEIVKEPKIFSGNDNRLLSSIEEGDKWKLRLEFAREVINFDGHSTITGRIVSVGLGSNSPYLLNNVSETFKHFGIHFNKYPTKILTTSGKESKKLYPLGIFRGAKRKKFENLLSADMSLKLKSNRKRC